IDNIRTKTGKDPEYFQALAREMGRVRHAEVLAWLKSDCGLGNGHANAMILYIQNPELARRKMRDDAKKEKTERWPILPDMGQLASTASMALSISFFSLSRAAGFFQRLSRSGRVVRQIDRISSRLVFRRVSMTTAL